MAFLLLIFPFLSLFLYSRGDEGSLPEFLQRLLDLLLCVHHEWTIPCNGLVQRFPGNQQKAHRCLTRDHLHMVAVTQHDEPGVRNHGSVIFIIASKLTQSWKPAIPSGRTCGISSCMMPRPAVIHCTSPAPMLPELPRVSL